MKRGPATALLPVLGLLLTGAGGMATADMAEAPPRSASERALWEFQVLLDGRDIGFHRFDIQRDGGVERVDIEARFEVEILFVTAYRYEHANQETWRGDCLQRIVSSTDDNGELYEIVGEAGDGAFTLDRNDTPEALQSGCLKTFAYWNPEILQADRLLNAQTGELKPVTVEPVGVTPFEVAGVPVPSEEYRLILPDGAIRLWYQQDNGQWLGLETETEGGRTLRYEPRSLPIPPGSEATRTVAKRSENSRPASP